MAKVKPSVAPTIPEPADTAGTAGTGEAERVRRGGGVAVTMEQPDLAGGPQTEAAPTGKVEPPFWFQVRKERIQVMAGRVVPTVRTLSATKGANAMSVDRNDKVDPRPAFSQATEHGWTTIRHDVDGPGTSYLRKVKSTGGWISRFETLFAASGIVRSDSPAFAKWLNELESRGEIPAIPSYALETLHDDLTQRLGQLLQEEAAPAKIEKVRADIAVVQARLDALDAPDAGEMATPDLGGDE